MYRQDRINEEVTHTLTDILRNVSDPRVSGAFVSITGVNVSKDLSSAKVYYSVLNGSREEVGKGLASANGFIRGELSRKMNMRITPKLVFISDDSTENAIKITEILKDIDNKNS